MFDEASPNLRLSFIVPVRNDAARLRRCLQSIRNAALDGPGVEIVVADNGSTDGSADVGLSFGARVLSLPGEKVSALRNKGAAAARGDILGFVDADNEIGTGWIAAALEDLANGAAAAGAPYSPPTDGTSVQRAYDLLREHPRTIQETDWLGSGNMAVRQAEFAQIGGFDETLETCEDVDLCLRLRERRLRILADPRMHSVHLGDPATLVKLFRGELWRGRDNLRVSWRRPRSPRAMMSAGISMLALAGAVALLAGLIVFPFAGAWPAMLGAAALAAVIGLRAFRMCRRRRFVDSPAPLASVLLVASTYEVARAFALSVHGSHASQRGKNGNS